MDAPGADARELARSLGFIRRINGALGYRRQVVGHLARFARAWPPGETITVLDVATGSGDIPRAILGWARRAGHDVRVVGLDRHAVTARVAQQAGGVTIVRGDALRLPFVDGVFDYAITSMFLHHLDDADVVTALREMGRVARRGIIASDLVRNRRAYAWISLFTLGATEIVRHDAPVSVAQAFTLAEAEDLRGRAGLGFARVHKHFGHRFTIAGEKERGN